MYKENVQRSVKIKWESNKRKKKKEKIKTISHGWTKNSFRGNKENKE